MQLDATQLLPQFSLARMSFIFNSTTLSVLLMVFFVLYCIGSSALWYHWSKYGMGRSEISLVKTLFVFVSLALFIFAVMGIHYF